jgi:hypothetical protein
MSTPPVAILGCCRSVGCLSAGSSGVAAAATAVAAAAAPDACRAPPRLSRTARSAGIGGVSSGTGCSGERSKLMSVRWWAAAVLRLVLPFVLPVAGTASAATTATAAAAAATALVAASPVSSVAGPVPWGAIETGSAGAFAAAAASKAAATAGVVAGDSPAVGAASAPSSSKTAVPRRATKLASLAEERPALGLRHGGLRFPARIPHPKLGLECLSSALRNLRQAPTCCARSIQLLKVRPMRTPWRRWNRPRSYGAPMSSIYVYVW